MINLCAPAIIYLIFSITQILIDLFKGMYNTAAIKSIVTVTVTLLLNILCKQGLGFVSWIIVFIPFILMTVVVSAILYYFGLDAATGKINKYSNDVSYDANGNIIIYDPEYNPRMNPVYYNSPNIIVPNPHLNDPQNNIQTTSFNKPVINYVPNGSSSPAYQS